MKSKLKIADAGNVTVPAFLTLQQKGYTVRCERSGDGPRETWIAESAGAELFADDPLALLGLATLVEARGAQWPASDEEIEAFVKRFGYDDVV